MTELTLSKKRIHAGFWEGVLRASAAGNYQPDISVTHLEEPLAGVEVHEDKDQKSTWRIRVPIPADSLSDGVQVYLINDAKTGEKLDSFSIVTGEPLRDDIRAELELVRAELDMLKRAFRRHCVETTT